MPLTITADTEDFVTLDEVKNHVNIPASHADDDDELLIISRAAQDHVESLVGPVRWRTVTRSIASSTATHVLAVTPVLTVDTVTASGSPYTLHTVDAYTGVVTGLPASGAAVITYTAGRTECPDSIRLAALIIAAHLWRTQLGNAPSGALPQDADASQDFLGMGFAIPARAMDLLAPHLLAPGFA